MTFLIDLLKPFALRILAGLAIAAAVLFVILRVRHEGRMLERAEAYQRAARNAAQRRRIEIEVAGDDDVTLNEALRAPAQRRKGKPQ